MAQEFMALLGKNGTTRARAFPAKGLSKERKPRRARKEELFLPDGSINASEIQQWQNERLGVYFVVNNGGDTKASITEIIGYFAEFDEGTKGDQLQRLNASPLPSATCVVDNGGKSLHVFWVFDEPIICRAVEDCPNKEAWTKEQARIAACLGSDKSIKDPSRVMRLPGAWYVKVDERGNEVFGGQARIISGTRQRVSRADFLAVLPELPEPTEAVSTPALPLQQPLSKGSAGTTSQRTRERMLAQLDRVPPRIPSSTGRPDATTGTRDLYTKLLWALAAELGDQEAAAVMTQHSPLWTQEEDLLAKCRDRNGSVNTASFFALVKDHWPHAAGRGNAAQGSDLVPTVLPGGVQPPGGVVGGAEQDSKRLTPAQKLADLQKTAASLLASKAPYATRLPLLRARAENLGVTMRDPELLGLLKAARRQRLHGSSDEILKPGDVLDTTGEPWAWEGLVLRGCLNLWVALPKVGKTALALAFLAAWHRNEPAFLDHDLLGRCPPVLIVGNDQGQADWGRMFAAVGWLDAAGRIGGPVIGLAHAGRSLHLDPEGIDRIGEIAQEHPGLLILIDSLHASVAPLGLKEESPEIAEPIADLMELVEPHGATVILVHHASKGRAGDGASSASRGSTALPALASQTLKLGPATSNPHDRRRLLTTEGRGGLPQALVIERDGAMWTLHGGVEALEQERKVADTLEAIRKNDRKGDTLDLAIERWQDERQRTTAADVVAGLQLRGKDPAGSALRTLKQLERAGVLESIQRSAEQGRGRSYEFWPTDAALGAAG